MIEQFDKDLLVVKVGTNTLIENKNGHESLDMASFARIGKQIMELSDDGYGVVLVSSGAIAAGAIHTGFERSEDEDIVELQRLAGIGWQFIVEAWRHNLASRTVGSMVLTRHELHEGEDTRREALATIDCHIKHGDVIIANENDAIAHDEITFGDNDILAGILTAQLAKSALYRSIRLVLLTDKNGFYRDKDDAKTLIRVVSDIQAVKAYACTAENGSSKGGMISKLMAAEAAQNAGIETFIANGRVEQAIKRALRGEIGTRFCQALRE